MNSNERLINRIEKVIKSKENTRYLITLLSSIP